jgi:hypothetical protein
MEGSPTGGTDHVEEDRMRTADQRRPCGRIPHPLTTGSTGDLAVSQRLSATDRFVPGPR